MTSRDVIAALQRAKLPRTPAFPFARIADLVLAAGWLVWLVAMLGGCSTDTSGLNSDLTIRGRLAVDAGSDTLPVVGTGGPDAGPVVSPDATLEETGVSIPDGGRPNTPDVGNDTGNPLPPSDCALDPTRSLTPCNATTALCRTYDTPGHAILQVNCLAEGYLCVAKCP
jgi:hypothetical protein